MKQQDKFNTIKKEELRERILRLGNSSQRSFLLDVLEGVISHEFGLTAFGKEKWLDDEQFRELYDEVRNFANERSCLSLEYCSFTDENLDKLGQVSDKKRRFLVALWQTRGIISSACRRVNISRQTFYEWQKNDETFKQLADEVIESQIDYVEDKLLELIKEKNPTAIIFYLKTRGRRRGWSEKGEVIDLSDHKPVFNMQIVSSKEEPQENQETIT